MSYFLQNIEELTLKNSNFRQVLYTGQHTQLVIMSLRPNEEIGSEVHAVVDQFIRIEAGMGTLTIDGESHEVTDGSAFIIPAGSKHNVVNTSTDQPLKLYTLYSPPHHKDGTVHATKEDAEADTEDHL